MKYVFDHLQLRTLNKSNVNNGRLLLFSFKISGAGYGGRSHMPEKQTQGESVDVKRNDLDGRACAEGRKGTRPQAAFAGRCDATGVCGAVCADGVFLSLVLFLIFFF